MSITPGARATRLQEDAAILAVLEDHSAVPLPDTYPSAFRFYVYSDSAASARARLAETESALAEALGVSFTEDVEETAHGVLTYTLTCELGSGRQVIIYSRAEHVCEPMVTGQQMSDVIEWVRITAAELAVA